METNNKQIVNIEAVVESTPEKVWEYWTNPEHIIKWNNASTDWHTPAAENDVKVGGKFRSRMEAKDGSNGFDFSGVYTKVDKGKELEYILDDNRSVHVSFQANGNKTVIRESFEAENTNSIDLQRDGWQSILNNFKKYVESNADTDSLRFEIKINAPVNKVYSAMLDKTHYTEWTSPFNPTSRFEGNWEQGTKILFIGQDQDGGEGGMVSRIKENTPNKVVTIEHIGIYKNGQEILSGKQVDQWSGAIEKYSFIEEGNSTLVRVDLTGLMEFKSYFIETWPKALNKLKEICEK